MKINKYTFLTFFIFSLLLFSGTAARAADSASVFWPDLSSAPAASSSSELAQAGAGDAALVVGVSKYAFVSPVEGADKNAADWWAYFRQFRGIPRSSVGFLRDAEATAEGIRDEAKRVAALAKPGSTIWFVFIGHGVASANGEEGLLVGVDAQGTAKSLDTRSIPQSEVESILSNSQAARVIMIVDSCFSGQSSDGRPLAPGLQALVRTSQLETNNKTIRLTAGTSDQFAGPLPGAHRPAFSYLVLGAIRGWGDENRDGNVTAEEAVNYANDVLLVLEKGRRQTPELIGADRQMLLADHVSESGPDIDGMVLGRGRIAQTGDPRMEPQPVVQSSAAEAKVNQNTNTNINTNAAAGADESAAFRQNAQNEDESSSMPGRKKAGIALAAVGGAGLVTGAVFLGLYGMRAEVCDSLSGECQGKPTSYAVTGGIVGGVGAAALVTGIVLMATSKSTNSGDAASQKTAFSISPTRGGMAVTFSGRF